MKTGKKAGRRGDFQSTQLFSPFKKDDVLILALSGGPDSVFLGELLFRSRFQNIVVAHFEHGIRGNDSVNDQKFCSKKAVEWDWQCETESWQEPQESEERARMARYDFLERVRQKHNAKAIVLAHHADDQVETILFQFLRGTGIRGLSGMRRWDEERKLFRPLLDISKQEILDFLEKESINFCEDITNKDAEKYDRNFLRLEVLPLLNQRFPHLQKSLLRNADLYQEMQEFIEIKTENVWKNLMQSGARSSEFGANNAEIQFSREQFIALPKFLRGEILRKMFFLQSLTYDQVQELDDFLSIAKSGKQKSLLGKKIEVYGKNIFVIRFRD